MFNKELKINKKYFNTVLPYPLDKDQRKAILSNYNNNIVVAGAGCGKTSTMIGKIKYLVEVKKVDPRKILVISFTNSAVINFQSKLNIDNVECLTFHKLGMNILKKYYDTSPKVVDNYLDIIIEKYFKTIILKNNYLMYKFILFMGLYLYNPQIIKGEKKCKILPLKSLYLNTNEYVYTYHDFIIANYLFIKKCIYSYEKILIGKKYMYGFNLNNNLIIIYSNNNYYIKKENKKIFFLNIKKNKIENLFIKLNNILNKIKYKRYDYSNIDVYLKIVESGHYLYTTYLIKKFIKTLKTNDLSLIFLNKNIANPLSSREQILFLFIRQIFMKYEKTLKEIRAVDFDDMINLSSKIINNGFIYKNYDYIIIDEFQDTSISRYNLLLALKKQTNAQLTAIGDDFQSIYRFSGCNMKLLVNFKKNFPDSKILKITKTHRNSQELINIAGDFVMKNTTGQITKKLKSSLHLKHPIHIYYYNKNILDIYMKAVIYLNSIGCKNILVLGRNNIDIKMIISDKKYNEIIKQKNYPLLIEDNIFFSTIHRAKGLEYDGVIICNLKNSINGFPNKIEDDPILNLVSNNKKTYLYDEERRLFYVALTRTKTKCILLVPKNHESIFVKEIKEYAHIE